MAIVDSGARRNFESGAVRDIQEGKGRTDLLPLGVLADYISYSSFRPELRSIFRGIDLFMRDLDVTHIYDVLDTLTNQIYGNNDDIFSTILSVSIHYEEGAKKYEERNWQKGIPIHCYIDSGLRHYLKYLRGDDDENHFRATIWNFLGLLWTYESRPDLVEIFKNETSVLREGE